MTADTECAAKNPDGSVICSVGLYYNETISGCSFCPAGKTSLLGAQSLTNCTSCAAGTFSSPQGNITTCINCAAGKYSAVGASSCLDCTAGTYSSAGASSCTKCKTCQSGEYQSGGTCSATADSITCKTCTTCSTLQVVETTCSATKDTVCSTKTSTPSSTVTPSPSAKASVNPAAPSENPPRATEPVVQVVLSFSNIPETAFQNASGIASLEASIAKAAKLDSKSTVKVSRVYNIDTKKVIFTARRLANANLEVTTKITTDNVASATSIGATLKASATTFAASVLSDLKTKDAATFKDATISVNTDSITVPPPANSSESASGLPLGAIIGIAVGGAIVALGIFGGIGYVAYTKYGAPVEQKEMISTFEFQSPMLKHSSTGQVVIKRSEGQHRVVGRGSRSGLSGGSDSTSHVHNLFTPKRPEETFTLQNDAFTGSMTSKKGGRGSMSPNSHVNKLFSNIPRSIGGVSPQRNVFEPTSRFDDDEERKFNGDSKEKEEEEKEEEEEEDEDEEEKEQDDE